MAKGIIYVMTTVVPGLIKIGKTGTDNYESRMYQLERNGYFNVVGLKRKFAIEVEDYDEKEKLLDEIFGKSNYVTKNFFVFHFHNVFTKTEYQKYYSQNNYYRRKMSKRKVGEF